MKLLYDKFVSKSFTETTPYHINITLHSVQVLLIFVAATDYKNTFTTKFLFVV